MNSQMIFSKFCKHFDSFKQVMNHQEKLEVTWNTYFKTVSFDHYENTKPVQKSTFEIGIDWVLNGSWAKYLLDLLQFPDTNLKSKGKMIAVFSLCVTYSLLLLFSKLYLVRKLRLWWRQTFSHLIFYDSILKESKTRKNITSWK